MSWQVLYSDYYIFEGDLKGFRKKGKRYSPVMEMYYEKLPSSYIIQGRV